MLPTSRMAEFLKKQRDLAKQSLEKADEMLERSPMKGINVSRGRNFLTPPTEDRDDSSGSSRSDSDFLQQPRRYKAINITELEEDKTIHLQATPQKMSFEPSEMAARATLEKNSADQARRQLSIEQMAPDIQAILNKSIAPEIRELSGMLDRASVSNDSALPLLFEDDRPDVSLPRTADMSRMSATRESISSIPQKHGRKDFWDLPVASTSIANNWMQKELSHLEEISFHSADGQQARLLEDENAWEQENAIIPGAKSGSSPEEMSKSKQNLRSREDDQDQMHATQIDDSSYCSVGEYFNNKFKSDDLQGMISGSSPPRRTPLPLVDLSNLGSSGESGGKRTPIRRTRNVTSSVDTDKENSLSVSKILKALDSVHVGDTPTALISKLRDMRKGRPEQAFERPSVPAPQKETALAADLYKTTSLQIDMDAVTKSPSFTRALNAAIARPNPDYLSDTASFTESLLESSAFVPLNHGIMATSSPNPAPSEADGTYRISTARKPRTDTYRISTATKMSEDQRELPPVQKVRSPRKCQKQILLEAPPVKPSRKRRSSSATRQELFEREEKRLEAIETNLKRSRSPTNPAELKAVSNHLTVYTETPKATIPSQRAVQAKLNRSFLSPEPRQRDVTSEKSPFSSPKSLTSSSDDLRGNYRVAYSEPSKSPKKFNLLSSGRSASQFSVTNSEYSHKDGTLPLKATHSEISWGSTKLRKSEKKSMQIKNTSNKKLAIKACITGPGFQLCGTEQILTLHSQECRTITVDFCPTVIGPAVGMLSFQPPHDSYAHQRAVSLYGYGGEASIRIEGIQKGPTGPYMELGQARNLGRALEKSFTLYNKGNLPAFARIGIDKKNVDQTFLASAVFVQPQKVIIPPNTYVHINVVFKPRRQEIAKILQKQVDVLSITNLHIMWGDEATRHRIRHIISLIKRNDLQDNNLAPLESVCETFPNERELTELDRFAENAFQTIHELFLTFREYELVLTVDRAIDETMIDFTLSDDSSALFKTMCVSSDAGSPRLPEDISPAMLTAKRESGESWSVRPTYLEFSSAERNKQFVIKSNFYTTQFFELNSNYRPLFKFSPMEGQIRPGQEVIVNVNFQMGQPTQQQILIVVYIENEKITLPVYVRHGIR